MCVPKSSSDCVVKALLLRVVLPRAPRAESRSVKMSVMGGLATKIGAAGRLLLQFLAIDIQLFLEFFSHLA